jgi:hypothetical protein
MNNSQSLAAAKARFGKGAVVVPSTLKSVTPTQNGNGTTKLLFQKNVKNQSSAMPYEVLLDQNDAFVVTHVGFFLLNEIVASPGKAQPQTYPNIIQFPASLAGLVAADLQQFYNGSLSVTVAQDKIFENLALSDCFVARTTQQTAATNFSESLPVDGYVALPENFTIYGQEKYDFSINRPAFTTEGVQTTATTNQVKVLMAFKGYTVFGAGSAYQAQKSMGFN